MKKLFILALLSVGTVVHSQYKMTNILLNHDNKPIDFTKVDVVAIKDAVAAVMKSSDENIKNIAAVKKQTVSNTLLAYDDLQYELMDLGLKIGLIQSTYSDDKIRETAYTEGERLSTYATNISLNEPLYKALKKFSSQKEIKLTSQQQKFLSETIISFEKNGMKLNPIDRKPLEEINNKLVKFSTEFDKNIADSKDSIIFNEIDLKGIDAVTLNSWKRPNGTYVVSVQPP